jgi:hypothetical protein
MEVNTGGSTSGEPASVVVELSPVEAASGVTKMVPVPPDGRPIMLYFPPGARDGAVLNVDVPSSDPATGAPVSRPLLVTIRVGATGPASPYGPPAGFPGQPGYPAAPFPAPGPRRPSTRFRVLAAVLGGVVLVSLITVPALLSRRGSDASAGTGSTTTSTAGTGATTEATEAAAAPLDPAAYQEALTAADTQLRTAVANVQKQTTPKGVTAQANALADEIRAQASSLSTVTAPAAASAAHAGLVTSLTDLASAVSDVAGSAEDQTVCTGGAANALLSRQGTAKDLRSAVASLASADPSQKYTFGSFLPKETKDLARRKGNGAYLVRTTGGLGKLQVKNGNGVDTVLNIVKSGAKKPAISVYIRGKSSVNVSRIKDGTYQVFLTTGTDFDGKRFVRNCGFTKFDDTFKFTTTSSQYTIWKLTLHVSTGGNASTTDVDPDSFPS